MGLSIYTCNLLSTPLSRKVQTCCIAVKPRRQGLRMRTSNDLDTVFSVFM